eukprot:CAMPEP_0195517984 /NCGR_PEP_ID=MMETSP0794_2-20130614/11878_1 /TAXON_ID=515487 /ORGANISM="Stephanopyxis turris, Strain CCMP 815" /LENGTH=93 /DNA_ID=CAMNT_0040646873 /DNA_START=79 /DNA_END=360 /DNA_ORIENTATION=+
MIAARSATSLARAPKQNQRRTFIKWMVDYPDKVMEMKAIHNKGGTCLGQANPTWLKQKQDVPVSLAALGTTLFGLALIMKGHYSMAFGINKKE